ncbi:MAG: CbtB-domain containing protein [Methylocystaceae bacterium]|jgi:cobalt transporter subunit CbtB|nr:CbtB-domain containing protein [Methylocystaceae bacterium]NBT97085.1 CbtB-domain containing protein [Methylocystaceae bacterium]
MRIQKTISGLPQLTSVKSETLKAAILALLLGFSLIYAVGFSETDRLHDSAHDSRHALSFPCH